MIRHKYRAKAFVLCYAAALMLLVVACSARGTARNSPFVDDVTPTVITTQTVPASLGDAVPAPAVMAVSTPSALPAMRAPTAEPSAPDTATPSATATPTRSVQQVLASLSERDIFFETRGEGSSFSNELWKMNLSTRQQKLVYASRENGFKLGTIALSPNGRLVATTFNVIGPPRVASQYTLKSELVVMQTDGTEIRKLASSTQAREEVLWQEWSPDGGELSYLLLYAPPGTIPPSMTVHIVDVDTGQDRVVSKSGDPLQWSPDGKYLALLDVCGDQSIGPCLNIVDILTGNQKTVWHGDDVAASRLAWRPGGDQIAVPVMDDVYPPSTSGKQGVYLIDVATGQQRKLVDADVTDLRWSPDGSTLAYLRTSAYDARLGYTTRLEFLDMASGQSTEVLDRTVRLGTSTWSKDGHALLIAVEKESGTGYALSVIVPADNSVAELALVEAGDPGPTW